MFSRTFRVLVAMVRGVCIVPRTWIQECSDCGKWVDPRQYRLPRYAHLKLGSPLTLFKRMRIYLGPTTHKTCLPLDKMSQLIREAGGSVSKSVTDLAQDRADLVVFGVDSEAVEWTLTNEKSGAVQSVIALKKMIAEQKVVTHKVST